MAVKWLSMCASIVIVIPASFHRRWFVCLSVITITKNIVDGFAQNFLQRFLVGKGRPTSCCVTIGRGMWK